MNSPLDATHPPPDATGHLPLLDHEALAGLLASLDRDEEAVDAFVATFISQWPDRMRRADESLAERRARDLYDCALSIKVAGEMVGAVRLSSLGSELEVVVRSGRLAQAAPLLDALRSVGNDTLAALVTARSGGSDGHVAGVAAGFSPDSETNGSRRHEPFRSSAAASGRPKASA